MRQAPSLLATMVFYFTLESRPDVRVSALPAVLWVITVFAGTLGLNRSLVLFNGRRLQGVLQLRERLDQRAQALANSGVICIVHGDFCLSNILFDIGSQIIRLIDPRGNFGQRGVYGDARYDIAKLRHSLCGLYDYILADMFEFEESDKGFKATVFSNGTQRVVGGTFDRLVEDAGYNLNDIRFLEGLLFISMLPLHHGHPRRQRMMYLTGLNLLNEVMGCAS